MSRAEHVNYRLFL